MMRVYRRRNRYKRKQPIKKGIIFLCIVMVCAVAGLGTINVVTRERAGNEIFPKKEETISNFIPKPVLPQRETNLIEKAALSQEKAKPKPSEASSAAPPSSAVAEAAVSQAGKTDASYFNDAVFVGDSRTQALQTYGVMKNATYYAVQGLMVSTISTKPAIEVSGGRRVSVMSALEKKQFGKVYIMLGVNELGWSSTETFIKMYGNVIDQIKKNQPKAQVYVQSILPVSSKKSSQDAIYNNSRINRYNQMIQKLAEEKSVHYLAVNKAIMDQDGALPLGASTDGIHPNKKYCQKWVSYLEENRADA